MIFSSHFLTAKVHLCLKFSIPVSAVKENRKDLVNFLLDEAGFKVNAFGELLVEDWCCLGTAIDRQNDRFFSLLYF